MTLKILANFFLVTGSKFFIGQGFMKSLMQRENIAFVKITHYFDLNPRVCTLKRHELVITAVLELVTSIENEKN